jgi:hypothetical protein
VRAAAGVVQPLPCLLVGPTRNCEPRRCCKALAGTDGNTLVPVCSPFKAMCWGAVGRSAQDDQKAQGQDMSHCIAPVVSCSGYHLVMCARTAAVSSCRDFTISQICGIMGPCPNSVFHLGDWLVNGRAGVQLRNGRARGGNFCQPVSPMARILSVRLVRRRIAMKTALMLAAIASLGTATIMCFPIRRILINL